jgi:outer membrane protein TolC
VQLDNIRSQEEIAWSNYVVASNAVAELLNYDPDTIMLPVGYSDAFDKDYTVDPDTARTTALDHRYELKITQADIDKSEIELKYRENQMRPDISFTATAFLRQTDTAYGYSDWWNSVGQLFAPDSSEWFVGVAYRLPFGKNAEKSALSQARIQMEQAADAHAQAELTITQQVNSVMAQYLSSRAQMQLADQNMKLAELAYAKAERLKNLGLASQFEVLRTLNTMLSARTGYIAAAVGYHQSYAQLEASQGLFN